MKNKIFKIINKSKKHIALGTLMSMATITGSYAAVDVANLGTNTKAEKRAEQRLKEIHRRGGVHPEFDISKKNFSNNDAHLQNVAKVLGISLENIKTQISAGKNIKDIVSASGMTFQVFRDNMQALKKENIKKDVTDRVLSGKITQAQADKILNNLDNRINKKELIN